MTGARCQATFHLLEPSCPLKIPLDSAPIIETEVRKMEAKTKPQPATAKMSLKLLVDKKNQRVLFAESSKEFVDFLFSLLNLPIGAVIHLLTTSKMVGSFGNLYKSVESLSDVYLQPDTNKLSLLKPTFVSTDGLSSLRLTDFVAAEPTTQSRSFYLCHSHYGYVTDNPKARCVQCFQEMTKEARYIAPPAEARPASVGYVKEVVTYTITDDLVVEPMSTISCVTLLNRSGVKDLSALEERVVEVGMDQGLKLLKEAMLSNKVLTTVFLSNTAAATTTA